MGWRELLGWVRAMNRQVDGAKAGPDSWRNVDRDPWWQQARAKRDAERRGL